MIHDFCNFSSPYLLDAINIPIGDAIKALWTDPGMKQCWDRRAEFQIIESVQYYFNKIDVIKMPDYLPDKDDILFSRVRTSGIVTERYIIDGGLCNAINSSFPHLLLYCKSLTSFHHHHTHTHYQHLQ
jgi:G-protein alpha subunit